MPAIAESALVLDDEPLRSLVEDILLGEGYPVLDLDTRLPGIAAR